jgi:hypothetical protein
LNKRFPDDILSPNADMGTITDDDPVLLVVNFIMNGPPEVATKYCTGISMVNMPWLKGLIAYTDEIVTGAFNG